MKLTDFSKSVQTITEEVGPDADSQCHQSARNPKGTQANVYISCENDDAHFEIVSVEPDRTMGCGCWVGLTINIRKKP